MSDVRNKVALITGASSGIGLATAEALAAAGAKVALVARSADKLVAAAERIGPNAVAIPADLTGPDASSALLAEVEAKLGPVDILMANAGVYLAGDLVGNDPAAIDRVLQTNVGAVFQIVRAVLPGMIERGGGDILITSSVAGHQAIPWEPVYSASKHAVQSFTHGLRQQVGPQNIRVQAIAPGIVLNDLWGISDPAEIDAKADAGDGLRSEDVAEAALFMLTRPRNVTIRDLVILPRAQQI
ncbi:MAG TPA: SDR family oxidoreductase [Paracoccus sp. (in: a-proteobacteria)]|uniref:SDR family oxidoreductase n=1 Tax=uncultured Paracoccus sp. TaxID=189685 RepID=UPI0026357ED5|nr:SDR family oxidoreductase [uncultured Paracoccus sp.]HMQ42449.1 SDR family oxidoreductase [Paracoccus sp. (in: a-proteobacteria)]HMR37558.1 SDR family oxidoreductase [Paracoccus sp. (in: a-proteobacteria)]